MRISKIKFEALDDLSKIIFRGFDHPDDGATGGSGGAGEGSTDGAADDTGGDGDAGGGDDGGDGDTDDGDLPDDLEGLRKALKSERDLRRKAEKGLKLTDREKRKLEKAQADIKAAEDGEVAAAKTAAEKSAQQVTKLAGQLRQNALEGAITRAARALKFRDPDDAITQLQRSNFAGIDIDQDDDDPSDIEINQKTVDKAVKAIATAKPHWLIAAGDGSPSGSSFNGGKPDGGKVDKNKEYAERYPALRNRIPKS